MVGVDANGSKVDEESVKLDVDDCYGSVRLGLAGIRAEDEEVHPGEEESTGKLADGWPTDHESTAGSPRSLATSGQGCHEVGPERRG